jgi:hypothetical protein
MSERSHRLDWALLLPATVVLPLDEVMVLGGSDDLAQSLVDHGFAASWRRPGGPADRSAFVVAWADCPYDIRRIASHVGPGGLLYLEIDRRRPGLRRLGPRSVQRGLSRGGCHIYSTHIVTPNLVEPRRYLPMDHTRALRWHLRTLFVAGTPITRAARTCLHTVLATPIATAVLKLVAVRYIVIGTTGANRSAPLGVPLALGTERVIIVTSGYDQASRAVVLPFEPGAKSPRFAVKVASSPATTIGTMREHERLIGLRATLPPHTARALPTPMGMYTLAGRTACVQSYAPGPSMSVTVGRWGRPMSARRRDLDGVVDWLTEFATATRVDVACAERDWTQIYDEAAAVIDLPPEVLDFFGESRKIAKSNRLGEFAVHQHYDAGPWNVHIDGAQPVLIDWETDDLRPTDCLGPPLEDIIYLATYWYFLTSKADTESDEETAIVRLFATPRPADAGVVAARRAIDRALVSLEGDRKVVPAVVAAVWAERAVYTHRRRAGLGAPLESGRSRPEAYLRALAGAMPKMFAFDGWWALPVGREPQ